MNKEKVYKTKNYVITIANEMVSLYHCFDGEYGNGNKLIMQKVSSDFSKLLTELMEDIQK